MQSTHSVNSIPANRQAARRRKRDVVRPATETWTDNPHDAAWMKAQALAYARWRLHIKAKWYENSQGAVWCGYLAIFLAWCLIGLLVPHLAVLSPRHGLAPDVITRGLLACLVPTLLCMAVLNGYSALIAKRAARLHDSLTLAATVQTLAEWLNDNEERHEIFRALTELLRHLGAGDTSVVSDAGRAEPVNVMQINVMQTEGGRDVESAGGRVGAGSETGADALTSRTRALLLQALRRDYDREPDFAVVLLRGLEQWGDKSALPIVTRVARQSTRPAVTDAAGHCLVALHTRFAQHRSETSLLRASEDRCDILLRSVHITPEDEAEQLLRVHIGGKPDS